MSNILVIHPPFGTGNDKRPPNIFDPHFPWGLGYICSAMLNEGYDIEIIDIYAYQWNKNEVLGLLGKKSFDYVCITAMATQYSYIKWIAAELRKVNSDCVIIIGGPLSSYSHRIVLSKTEVDICVIGPGEETIIDILSAKNNRGNLKSIPGIAIKDNENIYLTPKRIVPKNFDSILNPPFELFRMDVYRKNKMYIFNKSMSLYTEKKPPNTMAMITGSGCPFRCNFCTPSYRSHRVRSIESLIKDIDFFIKEYDIGGINFVDELLFLKKERINNMAYELGKRDIIWNGQARIDTIDVDQLRFYKENGLTSIGYGVESGSEFLLDKMNKKIKLEKIEMVLRKTIEAGLHLKVYLIYGYPGENYETVNETIDLFNRINHPGRRFSIFTPLPGSPVYDSVIDQGYIPDEDQYLSNIYEGFWQLKLNLTEFDNNEFDRVRLYAEKKMRDNYKNYINKLSDEQKVNSLQMCEEDFEKDFLKQISE